MGEINSDEDTSSQVDDELVQDNENVTLDEVDVVVETIQEEADPLEQALARAEKAEKEIAYKEAEIQNVRKRMMAEKATAIKYGSMGLSRRMIGVLEDFDRAINNLGNDSSISEGFTLVRKKFWAELESEGLVSVGNVGDVFDPSKMEAIATIPASDEYPPNTVVEVLEKGYMFKERVLQAAKVVVSS
ncbi:MAG: nucleotide exchange factor GrpE [Euryarchaeota archaeon]|nr:nucleotide exchange factor GrpE [Euryarchaeota archaeon]